MVQRFMTEEVNKGLDPSVAAIMAVKAESETKKRKPTIDDAPHAYLSSNQPTPKRPRTDTPVCENTHCNHRVGHTTEKCLAYGGGSAGQYLPKWKG
jgi:hypothetical protein